MASLPASAWRPAPAFKAGIRSGKTLTNRSKHNTGAHFFQDRSVEEISREALDAGVNLSGPWGTHVRRRSCPHKVFQIYEELALNLVRYLALQEAFVDFEHWELRVEVWATIRLSFRWLEEGPGFPPPCIRENRKTDPLYKAAETGSHKIFRKELLKEMPVLERLLPEIALKGWAYWRGLSEEAAAKHGLPPDYDVQSTGLPDSLLKYQPPVVSDLVGTDYLFEQRLRGNLKEINEWLDNRLREIKTWWKSELLIPNYRVRNQTIMARYSEAARLKAENKNLSWSEVGRRVDPQGFEAGRGQCIDRILKGVESCKRELLRIYEAKHPLRDKWKARRDLSQ